LGGQLAEDRYPGFGRGKESLWFRGSDTEKKGIYLSACWEHGKIIRDRTILGKKSFIFWVAYQESDDWNVAAKHKLDPKRAFGCITFGREVKY